MVYSVQVAHSRNDRCRGAALSFKSTNETFVAVRHFAVVLLGREPTDGALPADSADGGGALYAPYALVTHPTRRASAATSRRDPVSVLRSRFETCTLTVFSLMKSASAISALVRFATR